jgi:Ca2+-binding EF-hand superfamily protein
VCKDLESFRIDLALKHDFNLEDAFHLFDCNDLGCITIQNLADGLRDNLQFGEFCDEDMFMFMQRVDRKNLKRITFRQFYDAVLPFTPEYASRAQDRPVFFKKHNTELRHYFQRETREALRNLFRAMFNNERNLE